MIIKFQVLGAPIDIIFLYCKSLNLLELQFVKNCIKNSGATGSDQVTQLRFCIKIIDAKIRSFIDTYKSLVETQVISGNYSSNVGILSKFVSCYHYFSDAIEKQKERKQIR